jgi:hypothetical protein
LFAILVKAAFSTKERLVWTIFVAAALLSVVATAAAVSLVQRYSPHHVRAAHNEVAGVVYAVLGALYAVMLAFVVVNEWEAMENAERTSFTEADELAEIYWVSRALPADVGRPLEVTTKQYAQTVIDKEWSDLAAGGYSPDATALVYRIRDEVNSLPTADARDKVVYGKALDHVAAMAAARRERLSESSHNVPSVLWFTLILGAVLTVGYTFLFGLEKFWAHVLIAGPLAVLVVIALLLIRALDNPFSGAMAVHPESFEIFLRGLPAQR